jgi:hypothetical protein
MHLMTTSTELANSIDLFGDYQALRDRIAADGYLFMRGLLNPDEISATGRRGMQQLQTAGWTESGPDPVRAKPCTPIRAVRMIDALGDAGYRRIIADPGFAALPATSPMAHLMAQILGPAGFCYPMKLPRIVYPAALVPRQPGNFVHKDYQSVQDMFTCWVPLGNVPQSLGGLAVQPGSHRSSRVRLRPLNRLERGWRTTDYEAGDVLVFHCLTTHGALPNRQDRMRFSAEYRWQLADQPVPRRMVIGPNGHEIGSRMFAQANWWHSVIPGLTLFDDGGPATGPNLPAPPSRFVSITN